MPTIDLFPPSTPTQLLLLVVSFVLSAIIGLERQRRLKSAGLRTHTLVGIGAAIFTLVSTYGFAPVLGSEVVLDPSRIAAQVVSGIGFLGAGVIFVRQNVVNGLTTAASIWVTAGIGMACGAGLPVLAVGGTALYVVTVSALTPIGRMVNARGRDEVCVLRYKDGRGVLRAVLMKASELGFEVALTQTRMLEGAGKSDRIEARLKFTGRAPLRDLVEQLSALKGVTSVRLAHSDDD
ncbi:MgtC/SapB family protein [Microbacterium sp. STN6]|uniref:MgtC/SapB family protein n=1 Tax=Microbacterium sp. STN6 TaxID=2995588 RepID=UPI002260A525|nr:MgtC/SapB family protein [Microbacterium sp. STN6]MCX7522983.1 MgtC/SapB family protein [Microbacterium sp. STN6]